MRNIIFIVSLLSVTLGNSQILDPVKWSTSVNKISDTEYELITKASIELNGIYIRKPYQKEGLFQPVLRLKAMAII